MSTTTLEGARTGRVLSWGDMANPRRRGVVVELGIGRGYVIGAHGMKPAGARLTVVFEDLRLSEIPEHMVTGHAWRWEDAPDVGREERVDLLRRAREKREKDTDKQRRANEQRIEAERAFVAELAALAPPWAKAALVAIQDKDDCDTQTDYFAHRDGRRVLLAWSKHTRDLFPEMRKAAAKFEHTRHLVGADKEAEHREKYSMGDGYYLKAGYCHDNGWRVEKAGITGYSARCLYPADLSLLSVQA